LISSHYENLEPHDRESLISLFNELEGFYSQNNVPNTGDDPHNAEFAKLFD